MSTAKNTLELFFSERLKSLRGNRNKAQFSRELGIPAPMYQRYEQGQIPKEQNLRVIADHCAVTIDWLLGRDGSDQKKVTSPQGAVKLEKGRDIEKVTSPQGAVKSEKGQHPADCSGVEHCRYPERGDMPGELMVLREKLGQTATRMDEMEETLKHMSTQLETVVGLLGHALGGTMDKARPREGEQRKAG